MSKMVSLRFADDELIGWAESYAKERGVSRSRLIEMALADYRESCRGGVPDVEPGPAEVAKPKPAPVKGQVAVPSLLAGRQARLAKEMGWDRR
jgi:hypothetical protein